MKLSVIIPAYNHLAEVLTCLNTLQASAADNPAIEWLVQDDASPLLDMRLLIPPSVAKVERNPVNKGFAGNCNVGALRASGDVLLFCNQDIEAIEPFSHGWDAAILNAFQNETVGIVGARLLFPTPQQGVQNAGGVFDAHLQPVHRCLGWTNLDHPEVSTPQEVSWTTGAALAIRKDVFERIGGFDERYVGGYFEDCDLCMRVRMAGYKVWYEPRCTLMHKVGTTGGSPFFAQNALLFKSLWVDTHKINADIPAVQAGWW